MIKVIKTDSEHEAALAAIESLILQAPEPQTPEADELEILVLLTQDYEARTYPIEEPDPIEAIRFRMDQAGLTQRDLIPYIGSRSKVSEVLSGQRPLSLPMIRALHSGLGIPADILIQDSVPTALDNQDVEWGRFPVKEMAARGWLPDGAPDWATDPIGAVRAFFVPLPHVAFVPALYRRGHIRSERAMDPYALAAWSARILLRAQAAPPPRAFVPGTLTLELMRDIARLSVADNGPRLACDRLTQYGLSLIVEPHLRRTYVDGVTLLDEATHPIIGMSLRYDRLDNFWFCLMHELAHVACHFGSNDRAYFDDLDLEPLGDAQEQEADQLATEALIPQDAWIKSPASTLRSSEAAQHLARNLGIHPAIVAGRMRREYKAYRLLNHLIGYRQVRKWFPEITWATVRG